MGYKYYNLVSASATAKDTLIEGFQALLNQQFSIASDYFEIGEETIFGSNIYSNIGVRVTGAISSTTSEKLGDDFKTILFKDLTYPVAIGRKYFFDNNYWITIFTEAIKNLAQSCTVRRANNALRWVDVNGNYFEEPCSIEYSIKRPSDSVGIENPVTPEGFISLYTQLNDNTKKIRDNQRFLFGNDENWEAYRVYGNGTRNFLNNQTYDNESCRLLLLYLGVCAVNNDTDDIINGIADKYKNVYSVSASPTSIVGNIGNSFQISSYVTMNDVPATDPLIYSSSASSIASVSGSGLVTLVNSGSAIINISMLDNISASAIVSIVVSASAVMPYEIRVTPSSGLILEGATNTFEVYGYIGGVQQADAFIFVVANSYVPSDHYVFNIVDDNHFAVFNKEMYLNYPLTITATSGSYIKDIDINLRGAW
jgi:hypothetical protein